MEAPPFKVMTLPDDAVNVPVVVKAPAIEKLAVVVVVPALMVRPENVRVPEFVILPPVFEKVEAEGVKDPVTANVPVEVAVPAPVTVPEIVKLL